MQMTRDIIRLSKKMADILYSELCAGRFVELPFQAENLRRISLQVPTLHLLCKLRPLSYIQELQKDKHAVSCKNAYALQRYGM